MSKPIFKEDKNADNEVYLPKHVIIGIGTDNTFTFIDETTAGNVVTNDNRTPHEILDNPNGTKFLKIEVKRTNVQAGETSFQVGQYWYNIVLEKKCTDNIERVTKEWFKGIANFDKIFEKFVIYKNTTGVHDLVIANLKNLQKLGDQTSFYQDFKEMKDMQTMDKVEDIQKALIKPFFAIKSIIDMYTGRYDKYGKLIDNYFINDSGRFGFPNIKGDKSHIIASLQLLFDINTRCDKCFEESNKNTINEILRHVRERTFFVEPNATNDVIEKFENSIKIYSAITDPEVFLRTVVIKGGTVEFVKDSNWPASEPNVVIAIKSKDYNPTADVHNNYKEVGRIYKLRYLDHYIYHEIKTDVIYDDMSVIPKTDVNILVTNAENNFGISIYIKRNSTYRDFLESKFNIKSEELDEFLKNIYGSNIDLTLVPDISSIDKFINNNAGANDKILESIVGQYLADRSIMLTKEIQKNKFLTGAQSRFGLCNFNGRLSYFTAAMQLMYECLPQKRAENNDLMTATNVTKNPTVGVNKTAFSDFLYRVYSKRLKAGEASIHQFLFIHQLLNTEYCLKEIFGYIETASPDVEERETIMENYLKCVYYLTLVTTSQANIGVMETSSFASQYGEYTPDVFYTNYYYDTIANLAIDVEDLANARIEAGGTIERTYFSRPLLNIWYNIADMGSNPKMSTYQTTYLKQGKLENEQASEKMLKDKSGTNKPTLLPKICKNKCVDLLCTLTNVFNTGFNTLMLFEEDIKYNWKYNTFVNKNNNQPPNFIVWVNELPTENLSANPSDNNKITDAVKKAKTEYDDLLKSNPTATFSEKNAILKNGLIVLLKNEFKTNKELVIDAIKQSKDNEIIQYIFEQLPPDIQEITEVEKAYTEEIQQNYRNFDSSRKDSIQIEVNSEDFTIMNLKLVCGTYKKDFSDPTIEKYKHTENKNVFFKFSSNKWQIYYLSSDNKEYILAETIGGSKDLIPNNWIIRKDDIIEQFVKKLDVEMTRISKDFEGSTLTQLNTLKATINNNKAQYAIALINLAALNPTYVVSAASFAATIAKFGITTALPAVGAAVAAGLTPIAIPLAVATLTAAYYRNEIKELVKPNAAALYEVVNNTYSELIAKKPQVEDLVENIGLAIYDPEIYELFDVKKPIEDLKEKAKTMGIDVSVTFTDDNDNGLLRVYLMESIRSKIIADKKKNSADNIQFKVTQLGKIYEPKMMDPVNKNVKFPGAPDTKKTFIHYKDDNVTMSSEQYVHVGTIYKSKHHDYYYSYFSKVSNIYIDDSTTTDYNKIGGKFIPRDDMFAFITLYCRDTNIYTAGQGDNIFIYPSSTEWYRQNEQRVNNLGV
jgi:hypothetical protein